MLRSLAAGPMLALAACSGGDRGSGSATTIDVNAAAARAEGDIANYAAGTPAPVAPAAKPESGPPASSSPEASIGTGSAKAAVDVVQHYYALIEARKYPDAWALWRGGGGASNMSATAFATSFDRYADYHAEVGAPGDVDAGAGQRYVTVPVRVHGTLKAGGSFAMVGGVVLHRIGDGINTSDPGDRQWRIDRIDIEPGPADISPPMASRSPALPDRPD